MMINWITYLPHKAVAEVSKDKEPGGVRGSIDSKVNWNQIEVKWDSNDFGCQLIWDSSHSVVDWFGIQVIWMSNDLRFKWFGCQLIWDSNDLVVNRCVLQMNLVVSWFEIQVSWLSVDLRFNWFGCQSLWGSNDLVVNRFEIQELVLNWFEIQVIWLLIDVRFDWFCLSVDFGFQWVGCQLIWDSNELVVNWFEIQVIWLSNDLRFKWVGCQLMCDSNYFVKRSFSARLPSKLKLWSSKTKLFCETSFKNEALKIKNQAFLRDFLQNWSFEDQKRSFCARLPSKLKFRSSKTKLFCETSFKIEALKLQNEAFLRDFLQKWSVEDQKRSFSARLPSKMTCRPDTWPQNYNTF